MADIIQAMIIFQLLILGVVVAAFLFMQYQLKKAKRDIQFDREEIQGLTAYIDQQQRNMQQFRSEIVRREVAISMLLGTLDALKAKGRCSTLDIEYLEQKLKELIK